jgi:hypothetical protein
VNTELENCGRKPSWHYVRYYPRNLPGWNEENYGKLEDNFIPADTGTT